MSYSVVSDTSRLFGGDCASLTSLNSTVCRALALVTVLSTFHIPRDVPFLMAGELLKFVVWAAALHLDKRRVRKPQKSQELMAPLTKCCFSCGK